MFIQCRNVRSFAAVACAAEGQCMLFVAVSGGTSTSCTSQACCMPPTSLDEKAIHQGAGHPPKNAFASVRLSVAMAADRPCLPSENGSEQRQGPLLVLQASKPRSSACTGSELLRMSAKMKWRKHRSSCHDQWQSTPNCTTLCSDRKLVLRARQARRHLFLQR